MEQIGPETRLSVRTVSYSRAFSAGNGNYECVAADPINRLGFL